MNLGVEFFSSLILTKFRRYSLFSSCFAPSSHFQELLFFLFSNVVFSRASVSPRSNFDSRLVSDPWLCALWVFDP
jgi:hypothetical protein